MYVLVINQKNVSLGMSWLLVSTFLGNQPPKNRWSGKAHGSNPAPKKLGLEIQWPQKFRKEWCWLPKLTQLVTSETWYCDLFGGDSHLSRWWPETRWDFAPKSGDFHFFLNSWISLDMLAQQISCVCVCSSLGWRYAALSCSHGATHQCSRHYVIKLGIPGAANTRHGVRSIGSHRVGGTTRPHALPFEALAGRPRRWGMKSISWDVLLENEIVAGDHLQLQDATGRSTIKRIFWLL